MPISPTTSERGFTLVELLAVLMVMSLLVALAVPHLGNGASGLTERRSVAKLHDALVGARLAAMREGRPTSVRPADIDARAAMRDGPDPVLFFADGSSSGGSVLVAGKPVLVIGWLTGDVQNAR